MSANNRIAVPFRGVSVILAALLMGSGACTEPTMPGEPPVAERPVTDPLRPPQPPQPPDSQTTKSVEQIFLAKTDGSVIGPVGAGSAPAWSPEGRRIAFHRNGDVRVMNADGSGDIRLGTGSSPSWSPDGTRIVFVNAEGISVMNADGSSVRTILKHDFNDKAYKPWDMGVGSPAWSPDGARIAFMHEGDGDTLPAQIYLIDADGSNPRLLTATIQGTRYAESDPSWSPDGSRIVHWSYGYGITVTNVSDGRPSSMYSDFPAVAYGSKPAWSPNASAIAFDRRTGSPASRAIWIISANGTGARPLIADGYDAAWSPDGTRIAFVRARSEQ